MSNKTYIWSLSSLSYGYKIDLRDLIYLCYSVELVKKFSDNVYIYTDSIGKEEIHKIGIEANIIEVNLKKYNNFGLNRIQAKIKAIEQHGSNFCALDPYIFLLDDPENFITTYKNEKLEQNTFVQSFESRKKWGMLYKEGCDVLIENNIKICEPLNLYIKDQKYCGYNCCYLDGISGNLKNDLCNESIKIMDQLDRLRLNNIPLIYESLMFALADSGDSKILPIFTELEMAAQTTPLSKLTIDKYINIYPMKDQITLNTVHPEIRKILLFLREVNINFYNNVSKINNKLELT